MNPRPQAGSAVAPITRRALAVVALGVSSFHFVISWWRGGRYGFVDLPIFLTRAREFLETGHLYLERVDPVTYAPTAPVYKFPPLFGMLLLPFARDGLDRGDLYFHWVLQAVLYGVAAGVLLRLILGGRPTLFWIAGLLLALNLEPYFETVWRLQLETPILLLIALALVGMRCGKPWLVGAPLGVAAMLKVYPGFVLLYFVARRRWAVLGWASFAMTLVTISTLIVIGLPEHRLFFFEILPLLLAEDPLLSTANVALSRHLSELFGMAPAVAKSVQGWLALALLAVTVYAVVRRGGREERGADDLVGLSLFLALMLVAMPNSWINYQMLLLPALLVLVNRLSGAAAHRGVLTAALLVAYLPLLFYQPCADPSVPWPCARTPHFLGLLRLPRGFHDWMVDLRAISAPIVWCALLALVWRRDASGEPGPRT